MHILGQKRLVCTLILFWLGFLGLIAQLWMIQLRDGSRYATLALEQDSRWVSLEEATRGQILDRNRIPLTGERWENKVVVFPMLVGDRAGACRFIAETLDVEVAAVQRLLEAGPCYLPFNLTSQQAAAINEKNWPGVMVQPLRFRYHEPALAPQVLGHLGRITSREEFNGLNQSGKLYRYDDLVGKTGLEKFYEPDLKGTRPERALRVFADAGGQLLGGPAILEEQVMDRGRHDLVLTLDSRIQRIVEDAMDRLVAKGVVVVMEAGSGDILALAGRPGYHPAQVEKALAGDGEERFLDRGTSLYQPGSVFKLVVAAAALEEGIVDPRSKFYCSGSQDKLMRCWNDSGHGEIDFSSAFAESCNPVFARLGLQLGAPKLIEYAGRLGLGDQSVIGYPVPVDSRQDLNLIGAPNNLVNSSVGQGPVLATPLQITAMVNSMISGGVYRHPRLVMEVCKNGGAIAKEFPPDEGRQALSPATASEMCRLMEQVVDEGTGREALVHSFGSAGKTGSAQTGSGKAPLNAWFAGYAPRQNPRYIVTVLIEEGRSGGESAAPVFREVMEQILRLK